MAAIKCSPGAPGHGSFWSYRTPTSLRTASSSPVSDALVTTSSYLLHCLSASSVPYLQLGELTMENVLGLRWDAISAVSVWLGTKELERGVLFKITI